MASWRDTYEQLKKRKKQIDEGISTSNAYSTNKGKVSLPTYTNNNTQLAPLPSVVPLKTTVTMPTTKKKEEDKKWYEKIFTTGEFDDGYDFGDITKTILGTATDTNQKLAKGILNVVEPLVDIPTNLIATGFNIAGKEETAEKIRDFADINLSENISRISANISPTGILYNAVTGNEDKLYSHSGWEYDKNKNILENAKDYTNSTLLNKNPEEAHFEESSLSGYYADKVTELVGYTLGLVLGGEVLSAGKTASVGTKTLGATANAGNIGVTVAGRTLNVPTLAITGGMSSGLQEANSKEGVTEVERWTKGITSGLIEGTTEGMFGMFGVGGIKNEAGKEIFDYLGEKAAKNFSSRAGKMLANIGIKSMGEPIEEFVSYTLNYFADNKIIDKLGQADFKAEWDWGEVGEQMALAYASSLIVQGGGNVLENNSAIAEAEKQVGRKLTPQEKASVTQAAIEGTLEQKLGNIVQNTETNTTTQDIAPVNTTETAEQIENGTYQAANVGQINQPTTQQVESNLPTGADSNTQNIETNLKRRNFTYDSTKVTNENAQATYESASRVMNDTDRSHKFVDVVAKIATEKNTKYEFTNNEDIKSRGYDIEGKQVNGLVTVEENGETKILINIDSPKALNTIVGHETTHLLEGTQEYKDLQDAIFEYAKTKGEYNDRKAKLHSLYKNVKGANVNNELTADLVGDYLFTDSKFIESLSIEKPTLFQKLKELIDDLVVKFKGTKEEKQLREVQKKFREAYRQNNNKATSEIQYSIENIAKFNQKEYNNIKEKQIENKEYGRLIHIVDSDTNIKPGINHVILNDKTYEIYYKDYNEFKVMDVFDTVSVYSEVENDGVTENTSERIEGSGSESRNSQFSAVEIENSNSTGKNVELSDNNKRQDSKQKQNNSESNRNKRRELENSSFFNAKYSISDSQEERISKLQNEYELLDKTRDVTFDERDALREELNKLIRSEDYKNASSKFMEMIKTGLSPDEIAKTQEYQLMAEEEKIRKKLKEYDMDIKVITEDMTRIAEMIENEEKNHRNPKEAIRQAKKFFGVTNDFREAGYLLQDGTLLDFSGRTQGSNTYGRRTLDHREINEVGYDMNEFIELGNIRMKPESSGFELSKPLTKEQKAIIRDYLDTLDDDIMIDIAKDGKVLYDSAIYKKGTQASKIFNDLNYYFENGKFPKQSELAQFRYSLSNPEEQLAPTGDYNVYGEEVKLEEVIAPLQEEIQTLTETVKELKEQIAPVQKDIYEPTTMDDLEGWEAQTREVATNQDIAPTRSNLTEVESQELDTLEDIPFELTAEDQARKNELEMKERNSYYTNDTMTLDKKSLKALSKNIKDSLGLNNKQKLELENVIQEYSMQENASREDLYEIIENKFGKQNVETKLDDIIDAQTTIRRSKIKPTDDLRQMTDYFQIKQKNFGKISMSNNGMEVDKVYQELSETYKDLFPDTITNPADQFERIIEVANMSKTSLEEITLPEDVIQDVTDFVYESVQDYKYSEYVKASNSMYEDGWENINIPFEEVNDTETAPELKVSPKVKPRTTNKNVDWEALEDTSKGTQQQFNSETMELEDTVEKKTKKQIKQDLLRKTGIMNESLDEANRLPKILMENTDPIRLQEMIFGRGLGEEINKMFFYKVKDNTSEKIRFQNKERAEIKDLGIKARSKESAAVQKYGEKQWTNEAGETLPYGDKELASEFPNVETQNKIKRASEVIRQKYDSYLDTTNEVLTSLGYDAIPKRKDYMRHFQELNDIFTRVGIPYNYNEMTANDLPTDINGLTADFSPSKNFFASALRRKGVKTTYDAITGIDGYLEGIGNLIYHTEDIQRLRAYEEYIRDTYGENHGFDNLENLTDVEKATRIEKIQDNHLSNYASWLHEYTNTLAGKKSLIDRSVESLAGRRIYSFLNTTKTQVGKNMIGFNLSSAMTNIVAEVQALAKTNKLATVKGLSDTVKNIFIKDGFVEKNNFLTSRFGSDMLSKNLWQRMGDAGFIFMQGSDNFISQLVVRSKYNELKAKGLSDTQAHDEAGKFAARLMGDRSQGATANLYNSQMLGLVTQFQLEVNNQLYSMFYDTYHESKEQAQGKALKTAAGMTYTLGQLAIFTHLFGKGFEAMAGYNPTFDIIGMLMTAFGLDDEEEDKDTTAENIGQAFDKLVDALPYVNILTGGGRIPVSEALPLEELFTGKDEFGNDKPRVETLKEALPYYVLPSGYGQLKKTTKGLTMYDEDLPIAGSYTDSGNLRFTADDSTWGKIQAGIFGQWASDEAQAYVDSEFKSINKENIDELIDLGMTSSEYRKLKADINKVGETKNDKGYIKYTDENDNTYWYDKKTQTLYDSNNKESNLSILDLTKADSKQQKIEYIDSLDLTTDQKNILVNNMLSDNLVDEYGYQKYIGTEINKRGKEVEKTYWYDEKNDILYDSKYKEVRSSLLDDLIKAEETNVDMGDYDDFATYEEFDFSYKNPKKYEWLQENDISYDEYTYDEDTKEIYDYAYNNPETFKVGKAITGDFVEYKKYTEYIYDLKADKDKNGKSISGSRKTKVISYVNELDLSIPQKAMLIRQEYSSFDNYNYDIVDYVDNLDIDYEDKVIILESLNMKVDSEGRISW